MTAGSARAHLDAVVTKLTTAGLTVRIGGEGEPEVPGVVLWPSAGIPQADSLSNLDGRFEFGFTTVACGETPQQALWVTDRLVVILNRAIVLVGERLPYPIRMEYSPTPVQRDDDSVARIFFASISWLLVTSA